MSAETQEILPFNGQEFYIGPESIPVPEEFTRLAENESHVLLRVNGTVYVVPEEECPPVIPGYTQPPAIPSEVFGNIYVAEIDEDDYTLGYYRIDSIPQDYGQFASQSHGYWQDKY